MAPRRGIFNKRRYRAHLYSWQAPILQRGPFPDTGEIIRLIGYAEPRLIGQMERRGA